MYTHSITFGHRVINFKMYPTFESKVLTAPTATVGRAGG